MVQSWMKDIQRKIIATENIENAEQYSTKKLSEEKVKQDCESKAFKRLANAVITGNMLTRKK